MLRFPWDADGFKNLDPGCQILKGDVIEWGEISVRLVPKRLQAKEGMPWQD